MTEIAYKAKESKFFTRQNIAFLGMVVGMFMAILDIQIVASSLPVIAAGLSATQDELSWVQTSYIIAEVIIIPLTGFTAKLLSTRISYTMAALGFTIMSVMCASASSLEAMILFRAFQGFFGGAMIPTVFATIYIIFDEKQRPLVTVIIGLVVTMAPTLGPTIGGYVTDILSWHFMFLLNVIPGIFVCVTVFLYADFDKPDYSLLKNFDYLGIFLLVSFLAPLQYVLEEGTRKNWFENNLILGLTIYSVSSFIFLIYHELTTKKPILDLKAFKNKNFSIGCMLSGTIGVGIYGAVFLLPIFLGSSAGLDTLQIGIIMGVMGISQFLSAPLAGFAMKKNMDRRLMMLIGLTVFGIGCYLNSFLTPDSRFEELILPQVVRGLSIMFCFIPVNDVALGTLPKAEIQNASGLYNLMRNLGGAVGLAIMNSKITDHTAFNRDILSSNIPITSELAQNTLSTLSMQMTDKIANPEVGALAIMNSWMYRDAFIISINNIFSYLSLLFVFAIFLVPFVTNPKPIEGGHGH